MAQYLGDPPATHATSPTLVIEDRIGNDPDVTDDTVKMNDTSVNRLIDRHGYRGVRKAADNEAAGNW